MAYSHLCLRKGGQTVSWVLCRADRELGLGGFASNKEIPPVIRRNLLSIFQGPRSAQRAPPVGKLGSGPQARVGMRVRK